MKGTSPILAVMVVFIANTTLAEATPATEVDVELVLAVDISYSMDVDELNTQRNGYISAITSREVMNAIRSGPLGRIAVSYVEWAGAEQQDMIVKWHVIDSVESAEQFAAALSEAPIQRSYRTSISQGLLFSANAIESNEINGLRKVIDISGDGPNNHGPFLAEARDAVLKQGIAINGLPLMLKPGSDNTLSGPSLEDYYRECVIGGNAAFVVPVNGVESFRNAVRTKLILEIAGLQPSHIGARFVPAQMKPRVDCTATDLSWEHQQQSFISR